MKTGSLRNVLVCDLELYEACYKRDEKGEPVLAGKGKNRGPVLADGHDFPPEFAILDVEFDPSKYRLMADPAPSPEPEVEPEVENPDAETPDAETEE